MSKEEALRIMREALAPLGWQFVEPREPIPIGPKHCAEFALNDQAATRERRIAGPTLLALELLSRVEEIGKRHNSKPRRA